MPVPHFIDGSAKIKGNLEVTGAISAASLDTTGDQTVTGDLAVTGDTALAGDLAVTGAITGTSITIPRLRAYPLTLPEIQDGTTPPTPVTRGITKCKLFDAVAEYSLIHMPAPASLNTIAAAGIRLSVALVDVQTAGEALDMTCNYQLANIGTTGEGLGRAQTTVLKSVLMVAGNVAVDDVYQVEFLFPVADATNPYALSTIGINCKVFMTNITDVIRIHVFGGQLLYTSDV